MSRYVIVDAVRYAFSFIKDHVWALMRMLLVFMAISVVLGLVIAGTSLLLLQSLSNNLWLTVAVESPLLAAVGFIVFGIWSVSFITYLLELERAGSALVKDHLKKSWSLRTLKILAFDCIVVLFIGAVVLVIASVTAGAWWLGGMQLALWHRTILGLASAVSVALLFYLYVRLFFTKIVIADTNVDIFAALAKSWKATQAWFWRLSLMFCVVAGVGAMLTVIVSHLSSIIVVLMGGSLAGGIVGKVIEVFGAIFSMTFSPLIVLYYYRHLKVVKSLHAGK
jgi:membrane-anchored glycerophosphoryl diester phosphodiesterase (GDPDase)